MSDHTLDEIVGHVDHLEHTQDINDGIAKQAAPAEKRINEVAATISTDPLDAQKDEAKVKDRISQVYLAAIGVGKEALDYFNNAKDELYTAAMNYLGADQSSREGLQVTGQVLGMASSGRISELASTYSAAVREKVKRPWAEIAEHLSHLPNSEYISGLKAIADKIGNGSIATIARNTAGALKSYFDTNQALSQYREAH